MIRDQGKMLAVLAGGVKQQAPHNITLYFLKTHLAHHCTHEAQKQPLAGIQLHI
jgi:hypothetical protein